MSEGGWLNRWQRAETMNTSKNGRWRDLSIQSSTQSSIQSSVIDAAICHLPYPHPYRTNFITCSANNAMPRPEKPMRVSVIVHVRSV